MLKKIPLKSIDCKKERMAAAILAGGKASRLGGIAKGNLVIHDNKTIIQHLLDAINAAAISQTIIAANDASAYEKYNLTIVADLWNDVGPLAGITSALNFYTQNKKLFPYEYEAMLILPCDLPNITAKEITQLIDAFYFHHKPSIVFAATSKTTLHPLCAIINCDVLPQLQQAIMKRQYKIRQIWQSLNAIPVLFPNNKNFHNINSPTDI